jgi:regulator of replication initiation timing
MPATAKMNMAPLPAPTPATDLLDCDLAQIRGHLAAAYATRSAAAMWACCQDEAWLLGDVDRLATEVGRLRHDFAAISEDLEDATTENTRLQAENRALRARLNGARVQAAALALRNARLARLLGAELASELDRARTLARLAEADHARLIRAARAAVAAQDLAWLTAELDRRGLAPQPGIPAVVLAAPIPAQSQGVLHDG